MKETRRDILVQPQWRYGVVRIDLVLSIDLVPSGIEAFHRHFAYERRRLHARNRRQLIEDGVLCSRHSFRFLDQRIGNRNSHELQMLRIHESRLDRSQWREESAHTN